MFYVALSPDRTPLGVYPDMAAAQVAIQSAEPDVLAQNAYQIHPIRESADAERLNLKLQIHYRLEKFVGDYTGQSPVEVIEGDG